MLEWDMENESGGGRMIYIYIYIYVYIFQYKIFTAAALVSVVVRKTNADLLPPSKHYNAETDFDLDL